MKEFFLKLIYNIKNLTTKRLLLYSGVAIACVIIIGVAIYFQFFYINEHENITQENQNKISSDSEYEKLKSNFYSVFNNSIRRMSNEETNVTKIDTQKDLIHTAYALDLYSEDKYDINVNIPYINIKSNVVEKMNKEIDNIFGTKVNSVIQSKNNLSTYTLDYVAYINDNILSLVIRANLKELDYAQRIIIKTYNYDMEQDKEVTLGTILYKKNLNKDNVQNAIQTKIKEVIKSNEELAKAGYNIYTRNIDDDIYKLENTDVFFLDQNEYLYIIYPYGNNKFTTELDIIIF